MTGGTGDDHDPGEDVSGVSPLPQDERLARAVLSRVAEPNDVALYRRVAEVGAVAVLRAVAVGALPGISSARLAGYRTRVAGADAEAELARAQRLGVRLVCPGDPEWPGQLDALERLAGAARATERDVPPLALWVRGDEDLRLAAARSVAVIGARAATAYGEHVAGELSLGLVEAGWSVVSGAAYGIDAAAHRGAVAAGGPTIAVLACGPDVAYPRTHVSLLQHVARAGVVVSELPPGCSVTRSRFLHRNRLIAALTRGAVVVEAALRSGTARTAGVAGRLGRVVMAVPGPVTSATSVGCHALLRDGATLVTDAAEVIEAVGRIGEDLGPVKRGEERPTDVLDPDTLRVLDALPARRAVGTARLARAAGLDLPSLRAGLGLLLALGLAEQADGGYRVCEQLRRERRDGAAAAGRGPRADR